MYKFFDTIVFAKSNGDLAALPGANLTIYQAGTTTLATLYEDDETTGKNNPLTADSAGFVSCKIPDGAYDLSYSNGGETKFVPEVVMADPTASTYNPAAVAITGGTINGVTIGNTTPPNATFNDVDVQGEFKN